jgi:hypothetical protein
MVGLFGLKSTSSFVSQVLFFGSNLITSGTVKPGQLGSDGILAGWRWEKDHM